MKRRAYRATTNIGSRPIENSGEPKFGSIGFLAKNNIEIGAVGMVWSAEL